MAKYLQGKGVKTEFNRHVEDIKRESDGAWVLKTADTRNPDWQLTLRTRFLFLGAGGGALTLLQKSGIPEGKGYGGLPVSVLCSSATATPKPPNNTTPKCTGRLPSARRRCPSRTSTHAT